MSASYVQYRHTGDKYNAKRLNHFGFAQLEILRNAMRFQGLMQNKRIVEFASGIRVVCTSVFGIDTINIYVPPLLLAVFEKDVIIIEEYCWCTTYFTEGKILEVIGPELLEGEYDFYVGGMWYYYNRIVKKKFYLFEAEYTGRRYLVDLCRGKEEKPLLCHAMDFGIYEVDDKVLLFCLGSYTGRGRFYPKIPAFKEGSCAGAAAGSCFSCSAKLSPPIARGEPGDIDGTYAIIALGADKEKPIPDETATDVTTYKQVSLEEIEKDCIQILELHQKPDVQEMYYGNTKFFFSVDFLAKELIFDYGTGQIIVDVHMNCQSPLSYKDRMRMASYLPRHKYKAIILKTDTGYTLIGFEGAATIRCPAEVLRFSVWQRDEYRPGYFQDTHRTKAYFDLDSLIELKINEDRKLPGHEMAGEYRPVLISTKPNTYTQDVTHSGGGSYVMGGGGGAKGYLIDSSSASVTKTHSVEYGNREDFVVPIYTHTVDISTYSLTMYGAYTTGHGSRYDSIRPIVFTIPEHMIELNVPQYDQARNIPTMYKTYAETTYFYAGGVGSTASSTTTTVYSNAQEKEIVTESVQWDAVTLYQSGGGDEIENYYATTVYYNKVLLATTVCAALINADFSIRLYNIIITASYTHTRVDGPAHQSGDMSGIWWVDTVSGAEYNAFVTLYKTEVVTERVDMGGYRVTDSNIISSGAEVAWIKEKFLAYCEKNGPLSNLQASVSCGFAIENEIKGV